MSCRFLYSSDGSLKVYNFCDEITGSCWECILRFSQGPGSSLGSSFAATPCKEFIACNTEHQNERYWARLKEEKFGVRRDYSAFFSIGSWLIPVLKGVSVLSPLLAINSFHAFTSFV